MKLSEMTIQQLRDLSMLQIGEARKLRERADEYDELAKETLTAFMHKLDELEARKKGPNNNPN